MLALSHTLSRDPFFSTSSPPLETVDTHEPHAAAVECKVLLPALTAAAGTATAGAAAGAAEVIGAGAEAVCEARGLALALLCIREAAACAATAAATAALPSPSPPPAPPPPPPLLLPADGSRAALAEEEEFWGSRWLGVWFCEFFSTRDGLRS